MGSEEQSSELITCEEVNSEELGSEEVGSEEVGSEVTSEEVGESNSEQYYYTVSSDIDYSDTLSHIDTSLTFISSLLLGALILGGVFLLIKWFFKLFQF